VLDHGIARYLEMEQAMRQPCPGFLAATDRRLVFISETTLKASSIGYERIIDIHVAKKLVTADLRVVMKEEAATFNGGKGAFTGCIHLAEEGRRGPLPDPVKGVVTWDGRKETPDCAGCGSNIARVCIACRACSRVFDWEASKPVLARRDRYNQHG
jgi:hypothetical protein